MYNPGQKEYYEVFKVTEDLNYAGNPDYLDELRHTGCAYCNKKITKNIKKLALIFYKICRSYKIIIKKKLKLKPYPKDKDII